MKGLVTRGLAVASSFALVATMAACSNTPAPEPTVDEGPYVAPQGVTETEILFGSHQPLTGPAAPGYSKIAPAAKAYFDYVNATAGGVHGRKITYKYVDDGYNPANTVTLVKQLVEQDKVFAILNGLGTPTHTGVLDYLNTEKQIPDLFVASGAIAWDNPSKYPGTFAYQTDYVTEGKILGEFIKKTYANKKVCHLGQNDDFGKDALTGLKKAGITMVAEQNYVTSNTDLRTQIGAFAAAGCEVVALATIPAFTTITLATAAAGGFKPQFVASGVGGDYGTLRGRLVAQAGRTPAEADAILEGFVTTGYLPSVQDAENPWIKLFRGINDKYNAGQEFDGNILYGMSVAYLTVQALQAAGKNLTVEKLFKAIEDGGAKWRGPGIVPFAFSKDSHQGYSGVRIATIKAGVQSYSGPAYVSDKKDGKVTEYTEAPINPPANGVPTA